MNQRRSRKTKRAQQPGFKPPPKPPRSKESPAPNVFFVALVALVGIVGVLSLFGVGYLLYNIRELSEQQHLVQTLPDVTQAAPGETAILEGRIAASEPNLRGAYVAYIRERYTGGSKYSPTWTYLDRATPPLAVETGSRTYKIANSDYRFDRLISNWTDASGLEEGPTWTRGAIRIQGIAAKGPVMAVGRLKPTDGGALDFEADSIVGVSRAEYFDRLGVDRASSWSFAGILALLAALGIYLGWRGVRRVMR